MTEKTFFKLRHSASYRLYRAPAGRVLDVKAGQVITATTQADASWYRGKLDVLIECDEHGTPLDQFREDGSWSPTKPKSYAKYRPAKTPQKPAPPSTVRVGSPA
jgi:hypothetical protein